MIINQAILAVTIIAIAVIISIVIIKLRTIDLEEESYKQKYYETNAELNTFRLNSKCFKYNHRFMYDTKRKDCQEFIYILDYSDLSVCKIKLDDEDKENENVEDILAKYGIHASNAAWMFSDEDVNGFIELFKAND